MYKITKVSFFGTTENTVLKFNTSNLNNNPIEETPMIYSRAWHTCTIYRVTFKEWPPYSAGKCAFFEVYHTLWDIITPNKPILVKNEL